MPKSNHVCIIVRRLVVEPVAFLESVGRPESGFEWKLGSGQGDKQTRLLENGADFIVTPYIRCTEVWRPL